jgi:hypothetical protein
MIKYLLLAVLFVSCTTTNVVQSDKPSLVGTWVSIRDASLMLQTFDEIRDAKALFYDTLIFSKDTVKLRRTFTLTCTFMGDRLPGPNHADSPAVIIYRDTISKGLWETDYDGDEVYLTRLIGGPPTNFGSLDVYMGANSDFMRFPLGGYISTSKELKSGYDTFTKIK